MSRRHDQWAIPGALVVSLLGAVTIELVRQSGRTSSDVALAMLFYGGIAGGVLLIGLANGTSSQLTPIFSAQFQLFQAVTSGRFVSWLLSLS